jgi:riboflavin synthase
MFTGIIEETGKIVSIEKANQGITLTISAYKVLQEVKKGDSISISGACQTVTGLTSSTFSVFVSSETLNITTLKHFKPGLAVNLERAMKLSDRLGGHIVSGHIDGTGEVIDIKQQGHTTIYTFKAPENIAKYIIYKGSICIDGISLTISNINDNGRIFSVAIIPHTLNHTTLIALKSGDMVNLESDLIARYIEKFLFNRENNTDKSSKITFEYLAKHGFM